MDIKKAYLKITDKERYQRYKRAKKNLQAYVQWDSSGRPLPPPHIVKQLLVRENAALIGIHNLIETGTFMGEMALSMSRHFSSVITIELSPELHKNAVSRLAHIPNITVLLGDSSTVLKEILSGLTAPCLFWLDGHYSGGITAKGRLETPILDELRLIWSHPVRDHVILIDDARLFTGKDDYPTKTQLRDFLAELDKTLFLHECDDVFFVCRSRHAWACSEGGQFKAILENEFAVV